MMKTFTLHPGELSLSQVIAQYHSPMPIIIAKTAKAKVISARQVVTHYVNNNIIAYGINTGFGKLATNTISLDKLKELQKNLILSHAAGTGPLLSERIVKLIILLKINCLAQGYSGVRWEVIELLVEMYNANILPCIPSKGSVGASGDLAPLAHLAGGLLGEGQVWWKNSYLSAREALRLNKLMPLVFDPKEGLALLNGTQVSTALLIEALIKAERLFDATLYAGALSIEATRADYRFLDPRIHILRRLPGQCEVAALLSKLLANSHIHPYAESRVQDPYSIRCQPQVMGACLEQLRYIAEILKNEINAVTDNPLVFSNENEIVSGGNFHGQILSLGADALATVIATIGNISERRIALLMEPTFSGLPAFLVNQSGVNSGFMMMQVTAAALASENKSYAHPASVDSIPTSGNQEDHVSMATFAARRLGEMLDNSVSIVAIELLAACQGLDLLSLKTSPALQEIYDKIRQQVSFYAVDRVHTPDLLIVKNMIDSDEFKLSAKLKLKL